MPTKSGLLALGALLTCTPLNAETLQTKSGQNITAVIELYTSEGCSSCPPADQWLAQLGEVDSETLDVVALAFHVDYWDYIGWKDRFANPQHTQRQRLLAQTNRQSTIYTPGFYVQGIESQGTANMISRIRQANTEPAQVDLDLKLEVIDQKMNLRLDSNNRSHQDLQIEFVVFEDNLRSQVTRGENAGHELKHQSVVRYISPALPLEKQMRHQITLQPGWKIPDIGVAAIITSGSQQYLQGIQLKL
jgi:hypothetical protein